MQGQDTNKIVAKVTPIQDSVARQLSHHIGVGTNEPTFWNKLFKNVSQMNNPKLSDIIKEYNSNFSKHKEFFNNLDHVLIKEFMNGYEHAVYHFTGDIDKDKEIYLC